MTQTPPPLLPQTVFRPGAAFDVYRVAPSLDGKRTVAFGAMRIEDAEAGARLLEDTCRGMAEEGFEAVIGPMNGDTWHSYRHVIESDGSRPFMLEPPQAPAQAEAFALAGFSTIATYASARAPALGGEAPGSLPDDGVVVAPWDGSNVDGFLEDIHALCGEAFARNPFYRPLDIGRFEELYRPLISRLDRDLVLFARGPSGDLLGFVFGYPDMMDPRTAVLKTYASRARGVGRRLLSDFGDRARDKGFEWVIHALMHEDNESLDRSARAGGKVFRRYALLGKTLA